MSELETEEEQQLVRSSKTESQAEHGVGSLFKVVALFFLIVGFVAGIYLGNEKVSEYRTEFNWATGIIYWISASIFSLFLLGFGVVIQLLHEINSKLKA